MCLRTSHSGQTELRTRSSRLHQTPTNLTTEGSLHVSARIPLGADRITDTELSSAPQTFQLAEVKIKQWSFSLACAQSR